MDIPRDCDFDFLAEAERVFVPHHPKEKAAAKIAKKTRPNAAKPEPAQKIMTKKVSVTKKKMAA